ncbi:vacuolar transporter chaperone [Chloropicon primus]|nr:vacuolar transporter chaperone [Chloropicon primus]
MGFQTEFEAKAKPNERHNYVRYAAFKSKIQEMMAQGNLRKDLASREAFVRDFESEVKRLTRFASSSVENIWMRIDLVHGELPTDAKDPKAQKISLYRVQDIESSINGLGEEILSLGLFMSQNLEAFQNLAAKFEGVLRESGVRPKRLEMSEYESKCEEVEGLLETFLVLLSDLYARARRVKNNKEGGDAVWVPPESFQRKTTKYWVKTEDLMRVNLSFMATAGDEVLRDSQKISSVYYDTPDLQVYHNRLLRHDFASLVRVRWYGERDQSKGFPLFVERKVHREFWTGNKSVKERCPVEQQHIHAALTKGDLPPNVASSDKNGQLLASIQAFLAEKGKKQIPMVRTQYMRSAFQEATSNAVRISIDTDLKMIREKNAPRKGGDWCRDMTAPLPPQDVVNFPYTVLEVKLQDEPAEWVNRLTEGGLLVAVPKFSKFQNGMALLYPSKLRNSPWWFLPDGKGGMSPANFEEMADTRDPFLEKANPTLFDDENGQPQQRAPAGPKDFKGLPPVKTGRPAGPEVVEDIGGDKLDRKRSFGKKVRNLFVSKGDGPNEYHIMCLPMPQALSRKTSSSKKMASEEPDDSSDTTMTPRAAAIVRTRIEPKTFFANERTFLSWLQVSVIVIFMAFSLMDGSTVGGLVGGGKKKNPGDEHRMHASQISGALLAPVGIAFMAYALYMHKMRTMQILRRETVRFDDPRGPCSWCAASPLHASSRTPSHSLQL